MKVRSYIMQNIRDRDELAACLKAMQRDLPDTGLVTLYGVSMEQADASPLVDMVRAAFPNAHVVAGRVDVGISDGRAVTWGASLTFFEFAHTELSMLTLPVQDDVLDEAHLREWLAARREAKCLMVIWVGGVDTLVQSLSGCGVPLFGGMIYAANQKGVGYIYADDQLLKHGVVCVAFCGSQLQVRVEQCSSWQPIGPSLDITAMDGPFVIRELDGEPFAKVYDRFIGRVPGECFLDKALSFPLIVRKYDMFLTRQPVDCRETDGAGIFVAGFDLGDKVHFGYGDPVRVIYDAQHMEREMGEFKPQALFLMNCLSRWMLLEGNTESELKHCRNIAPSTGFYCYGELMGHGGEVLQMNMSLVMVGMREEGTGVPDIEEFNPDDAVFTKHQQFLAHLVHLVRMTTKALEEKNDLLDYKSKTDALTSLSNREALDVAIRKAIAGLPREYSVIMMDIDNFKGINDALGHDIGDESLIALARSIRVSLRSHDTAGRWGGDEFLVLLRDTDTEGARQTAERIKKLLSDFKLPDGSGLTLSIGITAVLPGDDERKLFRRVDRALYEAKGKPGKNAIVIV